MSRVYFCTGCGTIHPPHDSADQKPCCPDNLRISCDLEIADLARLGFKVDLLMHGIAPNRDAYLSAYALLRDTPTSEVIQGMKDRGML